MHISDVNGEVFLEKGKYVQFKTRQTNRGLKAKDVALV